MSIAIYGEIALDWLIARNEEIRYRKGGAGLYAALCAAKLRKNVELLTILGSEIDEYSISVWNDLGVSFNYAKFDTEYNISKYIVTGFENYQKKVSRPVTSIRSNYKYSPVLPKQCEAVLIFPISHSIPKNICIEAKNEKKLVLLDPKPNSESIADTREILEFIDILLVNEEELFLLSLENYLKKRIEKLLRKGPQYIIIKRGIKGCVIAEKGRKLVIVPSYKSNAICTLGSGDVFGGALTAIFLETQDIVYSVKFSSCLAASFIESIETERMPSRRAIENYLDKREIISFNSLNNITVYLAGPFFSKEELNWVNYIHECLEGCGVSVLSPYKENGVIDISTSMEGRNYIFNSDLVLLHKSDIVVALLDHNDPGTCFEIGYAYSEKIPVIGLKTSKEKLNNMLLFGCNKICDSIEDLISEVYINAEK